MTDIKHIGRIRNNGKKCIVVFRTLPGDAFNALIVLTESLTASYHDALINLVESNASQTTSELSEVLARALFPDGTTVLPSLHRQGLLTKVPTDQIEMTPNSNISVVLAELNQMIAEQKGISVQDLAMKDPMQVDEVATAKDISPDTVTKEDVTKTTSASVTETVDLSPEAMAKKYRSDADRLSKEAAQLRRMAEDLVPTKKKVAVKE
jgi:hypothetical protein